MNPFRFILNRLLKSVRIGNVPANYISLLLTGGLFGISTYFYYQQAKTSNILNNTISSYMKVSHKDANNNFIVNVSNRCAPSVVAIEVRNSQRMTQTGDPMLTSTGSGFVVKPNGWIITNAHVIMNKPNSVINIIATNGAVYEATVTDIDLKLDLALLKIDSNKLPALEFGTSQNVNLGEWVVALGSPLSMKHTITAGVVSSIDRNAKELGIKNLGMKYIQTDAAITFGHSGGPLVNLSGEVIGVNNLRITAGIAFAIPIDYVKEFLLRSETFSNKNQEIQNSMKHPRFGITTLPVTKDVISNLLTEQCILIPENTKGVLIWNVINGSPAFRAGLQTGDLITHVNHKTVHNVAELYIMLHRCNWDDIIFTLVRKGVVKALVYKKY